MSLENEINESLNMGFIGHPLVLYMNSLENLNEGNIITGVKNE